MLVKMMEKPELSPTVGEMVKPHNYTANQLYDQETYLLVFSHESKNIYPHEDLCSFKCSGFIHNLASNLKQSK